VDKFGGAGTVTHRFAIFGVDVLVTSGLMVWDVGFISGPFDANVLTTAASLRFTENESCLEVIAKDEICRADANQSKDNH
jgi:hypothetical protein